MNTVYRKEAVAKGLQRYYTGIPCVRGHLSERRTKNSICLACWESAEQVRRPKRAKYRAGYKRKWRIANPEAQLIIGARQRAKRKGIAFTIKAEDIRMPDKCPVLGLILEYGKGCVAATSPTIDRLDSAKGYVPGNVAVISHRANAIKNSGTEKEHRAVAEWMRKESGK